MTGSRGYECVDGPMAGVILMTRGQPEAGSLWNVGGEAGAQHVYRFTGNHFEYTRPIDDGEGLSDGQ